MRTFTTLLILSVISASLFLTISLQQAKAGSDIAPDKFENKPFASLLPETMDGDPPFSIVNGRLVANGDSEEEKALVSNFNNIQDDNLRTTTLGYIEEVLADTNLTDLRKRIIVNAYMNAALVDGNVVSRRAEDIGQKYKTYLTEIEEMAGGDGEVGIDEDEITSLSHTQLLAQNTTYANNYKYVQDHFGPAVSMTCADIAGERAMTPDEQKAYLISNYGGFHDAPQTFTTANKKAFLGLYFNDVSWNTATKAQIDQKFGQLMRETKLFIATGNPAGVPIPQNPNAEQSIDDVGADVDETGGY